MEILFFTTLWVWDFVLYSQKSSATKVLFLCQN